MDTDVSMTIVEHRPIEMDLRAYRYRLILLPMSIYILNFQYIRGWGLGDWMCDYGFKILHSKSGFRISNVGHWNSDFWSRGISFWTLEFLFFRCCDWKFRFWNIHFRIEEFDLRKGVGILDVGLWISDVLRLRLRI